MNIIILSPNANVLLTSEHFKKLHSIGNVIIETTIVPLCNVKSLYEEDEEKILAIDPDFCDWKINNIDIENIPNLKAICLETTSFNWIDIDFAKSKGIPVTNIKGFSTDAVAEWAFMMAINLSKKIPLIIRSGWKQDYEKFQGIELKGKKVAVIGLGNIGKRIAELCQGFGMEISYWSKNTKDERFKYEELNELFKTSDVIFPVVAQNPQTQGIITDEMLKSMKKSVIFVSDIHEVYNHQLLLDMVKNNEIYGYAFEAGPERFNEYEGNVFASPELAWCTDGSMKRNAIGWVKNIMDAVNGDFSERIN